ncbi:hypothetical protein NL108_000990 [Boleophthalmus pectinirostris]|nr:hypothetical protein NL108_000990 [Boleophthalmus pectinirostris]
MHTHLIPPSLLYFLLFQPLLVRWLLALQSSSPQQLQQSPRQYPWPADPTSCRAVLSVSFFCSIPSPPPPPPPPLPNTQCFYCVSYVASTNRLSLVPSILFPRYSFNRFSFN